MRLSLDLPLLLHGQDPGLGWRAAGSRCEAAARSRWPSASGRGTARQCLWRTAHGQRRPRRARDRGVFSLNTRVLCAMQDGKGSVRRNSAGDGRVAGQKRAPPLGGSQQPGGGPGGGTDMSNASDPGPAGLPGGGGVLSWRWRARTYPGRVSEFLGILRRRVSENPGVEAAAWAPWRETIPPDRASRLGRLPGCWASGFHARRGPPASCDPQASAQRPDVIKGRK